MRLSVRPTDFTGNFRITVHGTPENLSEEDRRKMLSTLRGISSMFADKYEQPSWKTKIREGAVVVK